MKNPVPILLGGVLLGSALAGVAALLLLENDSADTRAASPEVRAARNPDAELLALQERVDELTRENAELSMRLATLEERPVVERRAPIDGFVTQSELEALREELLEKLAVPALAATEPEEFKEQVQGALIDLRKQERFDKVREQQEKRAERLDEDVQKVSDWLQLNAYQTDEIRTALAAQYEREDEVRRLWEAGESDEVLGERKAADRALFVGDTERILTPEQYETFWNRFGGGAGKD